MKCTRRCPLTSSTTIVLAMLCLFILLLTGCDHQKQKTSPKIPNTDLEKITIGLIPEQDIFTQKKRYEPLMAYLSEQLGVPIETNILSRYGNIIDNFNELGLDGAFFGSFTGAMAIKKRQKG